jgi:hypothetical protein
MKMSRKIHWRKTPTQMTPTQAYEKAKIWAKRQKVREAFFISPEFKKDESIKDEPP